MNNKTEININVTNKIKDSFNEYLSTLDEIRFVECKFGLNEDEHRRQYEIFYPVDTFSKIDPEKFANVLIDTVKNNLDKYITKSGYAWIKILTDLKVDENNDEITDKSIENVCQLDSLLSDALASSSIMKLNYLRSVDINILVDSFNSDDEDEELEYDDPDDEDSDLDDDEIEDDDEDDIEDTDEEEINEPDNYNFNNENKMPFEFFGVVEGSHPFDDMDYYKKKKKRKKNHSSYTYSRVFKSSKNSKKCYKRHGVLIVKNKSLLKKDEKIIREFLKEFIPGKSLWVKEFRNDILKRWMKMYVLSKKNLKKLQKTKKKNNRKNSSKISKDTAMNFTRRLFSTDSWNDPKK